MGLLFWESGLIFPVEEVDVARFAGGAAQAGYVDRVRGLPLERCLVVPVDVGKSTAVALVADHYGQILVAPFEFGLTVSGVAELVAVVAEVRARVGALSVRVGWRLPGITIGHWPRRCVAMGLMWWS